MAVLAEWTQPKSAAAIEARQAIEQIRPALRRYPLWWVALGIPTFYAIYRFEPDRFWLSTLSTCAVAAVLWLPLYMMLKDCLKIPQHKYRISDKGLVLDRSFLYRWRYITAYRFTNYPQVGGLRCLEFLTSRRYRRWWSGRWQLWPFDPSEADEFLLRSILEEHLPGKCLDNMPEGSD